MIADAPKDVVDDSSLDAEPEPRHVAQAAEIAAIERDWEHLENAALELLGTARRRRAEASQRGDGNV